MSFGVGCFLVNLLVGLMDRVCWRCSELIAGAFELIQKLSSKISF